MYREPVVTAGSREKKTIGSGEIKATGILLEKYRAFAPVAVTTT
jgi:hypothetical protein